MGEVELMSDKLQFVVHGSEESKYAIRNDKLKFIGH
jgi:hypothetical protein